MKNVFNFRKSLIKAFKIIKDYKLLLFLIVLICILASIFNSLAPFYLSKVTDTIYSGVTTHLPINKVYVVKLLFIVLSCYIINAICIYFKNYISSYLGQKVGYDLRKKIIKKINRVKIKEIDSMRKGNVISKVINDVERLTDNITAIVPDLIYSLCLLISFIIMMLIIDKTLAIICFILIPLMYYILSLIVKKTQKYFDLNQLAISKVNTSVEQSITASEIISTYSKEKYFERKFDEDSMSLSEYGFKSSFYSSLSTVINKLLSNLNYIIVIAIGSYKVMNNLLNIGAIQAFIQYLKDFNKPMNTLSQMVSNLQMASSSYDRINELLSLEDEESENEMIESFKNSIEFKNVTFGYEKNKKILKNFSLTIKKGQRVAIVGSTGEGKSTIVNLLMGYYDNYEGQILIDGIDIKTISKKSLRNIVSCESSESWLFDATLKENIAFDGDFKEEEINNLVNKLKINHTVEKLPNGFNYKLEENDNSLSISEKQLLCLSRTINDNNEVLILDEATSNVDTRVEDLIHNNSKEIVKDKTLIVIAHRLSTIINSDKIIVIKNGQVVEEGTHKSLIKMKKEYYKLYNTEFDNIELS